MDGTIYLSVRKVNSCQKQRVLYGGPKESRHKQELHGTNENFTAQTRTSRHKRKLHGKNKNSHGTNEYSHGTNENFTAQTKTSRHKQELHGTNKNCDGGS